MDNPSLQITMTKLDVTNLTWSRSTMLSIQKLRLVSLLIVDSKKPEMMILLVKNGLLKILW